MSRNNDIWLRKPEGLVLGLDFSGGRVTSPTGHSGSLLNGASVSGRALVLDGVNDYLDVPDSADLTFNVGGQDQPFSCSAWVYPSVSMAALYSNLVLKGGVSGEYLFRISNAGPLTMVILYNNGSFSAYRGRTSATSPTVGQWSHMAFTYTGNESQTGIKIYQNTVRIDTGDVIVGAYTGMTNTTDSLRIGEGVPGNVSDFRIYNRALTAPEIAQIYNAGAARIALGGTP